MRSVVREDCPDVLNGPTSPGGIETAAAIKHYESSAGAEEPFKFAKYSDPQVKAALRRMFHGKCAYCETYFEATQPVDVEHYRPKGRIVNADGQVLQPGYYWLAATWTNLLPSCIDCNRKREQDVRDGKARQAGKADLFPLLDEDERATRPGEETREGPVLLDPCQDAVDECFRFEPDGTIAACGKSPVEQQRSSETIRILGLDREGLRFRREDRCIIILATLRHVVAAWSRAAAEPENQALQEQLQVELSDLKRLVAAQAEYTTMAKQLARRTLPDLSFD